MCFYQKIVLGKDGIANDFKVEAKAMLCLGLFCFTVVLKTLIRNSEDTRKDHELRQPEGFEGK